MASLCFARRAECVLPLRGHAMNSGISQYRRLIEWSLSAVALTIIVLVMLLVDSPVRQYGTAMLADAQHNVVAMRIPEPVALVGRNIWRLCMDHKPLAGFAAVASVLVLFMRRMR